MIPVTSVSIYDVLALIALGIHAQFVLNGLLFVTAFSENSSQLLFGIVVTIFGVLGLIAFYTDNPCVKILWGAALVICIFMIYMQGKYEFVLMFYSVVTFFRYFINCHEDVQEVCKVRHDFVQHYSVDRRTYHFDYTLRVH